MDADREFSKEKAVENHNKGKGMMQAMASLVSGPAHSSVVSIPRPEPAPCSKAVDELTSITLREMTETDHVYTGRVLKGKLCEEPFQLSAVYNILEDENGHAVTLSIYNHPPRLRMPNDMHKTYKRGRNVAVKEPHLIVSASGILAIRIDNHSALSFL